MKISEFRTLASSFEKIVYADLKQRERQRAVGAGYKGVLKDALKKLFYILFELTIPQQLYYKSHKIDMFFSVV